MGIIIDSSNKKISQIKQYGKILIETTVKPENNSEIILGSKQSNTQGSINNKVQNSPEPKIDTQSKPKINVEKRKLVNITKSIKLGKGQKLSINQNTKNIAKLIATLDFKTFPNVHSEFDLDVSVFMVDVNGKTAESNFIFYENAKSVCGGILLKEDHNASLKDAYNEVIQLDLNKIPRNIEKLAFTITIYEADERHQNFGQVSEGYFRIISSDTKEELLSYKFNDNLSTETAVVVAEIYRYKDEWKINCIGSGFKGGLEALCVNYGIETT